MRILVHHDASPGFVQTLTATAPTGLELTFVAESDHEGLLRALPRTHAILHVLEPLTRLVLESAPELLLVQKIGVGVNTIDLEACRELGIGVANMPGTNTQAVVEMTLTLMLAALRRIPAIDAATRRGEGWPLAPEHLDLAGELGGRTVGLVGYGAVARGLTPVLHALGCEVVVHTRRTESLPSAVRALPLDELLAVSDVVSLHAPLTTDTRQLLSRDRIARMKRGAVLVNTARGGLVDTDALIDALDSGRLRAAGLDVFADEPVAPGSPLLGRSDVVVTPHVAWRTPETLERSFAIAFANCRSAMRGAPLAHQVLPVVRRRDAGQA